ncbi:MAG: ATP-binding cassette domain-containing protein [Coriobacteriia bacterium]|nr:ATP-binding cassette domain-containing protein [Coriobacteriia bacterium]
MDAAIETVGLKKTFPAKGKGGAVEAVRGVDLSIPHGEIFGFLGPNGAGKTTCQRMLTTLLPIGAGQARVAGFDVAREPSKVRCHIGAVGQLGGSDGPATGRENLMLSGRLYGLSRRDTLRKIDEVSELLDLGEPLDRVVNTWSGGQKRRLEIALGIMHEPEVLFMDEPSTGLDPQNRANLWTHILRLKERGMTIFLTTHYLEEADALADRLAIIDHGEIVAEGTPEELKRQVSPEEVAQRIQREVPSGATLDDVFFKICGRRLRDAESEEEEVA